MTKRVQKPKDSLGSSYNQFINSEAGQDFIQKAEALTTDFIVQATRATETHLKARFIDQLAGITMLRDYVVRRATGEENYKKFQERYRVASGGGEGTLAPTTGNRNLTQEEKLK